MAKKKTAFTIHIEGKYRPTKIENIHEHLQNVNAGVGSHKVKKGKGSYSRKDKHKGKRLERNWDY